MTRFGFLRLMWALITGTTLRGTMSQRPDQGYSPPVSPVAPSQSAGVLRAREVIIFGTGVNVGLFVYSGTPALGNPPQLAIVPTGVTVDPFGNAITLSKILIQANVITETAGIFRTAATAPLIQLDGPHDAEWIYNAAGAMVAALAGVAGNDGLGNTYPAGVTAFLTIASGIGAGRYQISLSDQASPYAQLASLTFKNLTHAPNLPPAVSASTDATHGNSLSLDTGRLGSGDNDAVITLQDSHASGAASGLVSADTFTVQPVVNANAALEVVGYLDLVDVTSVPAAVSGSAVLFADANGFPTTRADSASGDTAQYAIGHVEKFDTSDQLINSTTFATVCGSTVVGTGTYRVRAVLTSQQGPNVVADNYRLGFTGTISQVRMSARYVSTTAGGQSVFADVTTSNNGVLATPAYAANAIYVGEFDGIIVTTSSGTLSIQAQCSGGNAANTFTVLALSFFEVVPAN